MWLSLIGAVTKLPMCQQQTVAFITDLPDQRQRPHRRGRSAGALRQQGLFGADPLLCRPRVSIDAGASFITINEPKLTRSPAEACSALPNTPFFPVHRRAQPSPRSWPACLPHLSGSVGFNCTAESSNNHPRPSVRYPRLLSRNHRSRQRPIYNRAEPPPHKRRRWQLLYLVPP